MRILLIGASGTIGKAIHQQLVSEQHTVVTANHSSGDFRIDLSDPASVHQVLSSAGTPDAIICAAGLNSFKPFAEHTDEDFRLALDNKLMGQVNLVRNAAGYVKEGGSVTLTSGSAATLPLAGSTSISMACGALESFVKALATEDLSIRVNVVSPTFVKESMAALGMPDHQGVSAADTALAYAASVNGAQTGTVIPTSDYAS